MALETLKDCDEIGGYKVLRNLGIDPENNDHVLIERGNGRESITWEHFDEIRDEIRDDMPVSIADDINAISFRLQDGPIKEVGVNGCQVDTLIHAARDIIFGLNEKFPCKENSECIAHLATALKCLDDRTKRRTKQGTEGYNKELPEGIPV